MDVTRHIVVGVDGSPESVAALQFAYDEARLRGRPLRVVCVWSAAGAAYVGEAFTPTADFFLEAEHHAEDVLRDALERLGPDPGVVVEAISVEGSPADELIEQAREAELLVVGSRGRGATKSLLLGSVSRSVAHHTRCPIVIVPHEAG
jgi:nucleotide-binding universal stress UspA family protein